MIAENDKHEYYAFKACKVRINLSERSGTAKHLAKFLLPSRKNPSEIKQGTDLGSYVAKEVIRVCSHMYFELWIRVTNSGNLFLIWPTLPSVDAKRM